MNPQASSSNRVYGLDILRALAILFVIYSHSFFLIVDHINERAYNLFSLDGVTIFFVLSGFLIGGILLKLINTTPFRFRDLLQFWIRRWFRTLPNYFFMLLLLIALALILKKELPGSLSSYFFFLQNFASPHPGFFPEAWSLSVEEWFYLMVPAGLFLSFRLTSYPRKQVVLVWIVGFILLVTTFRLSQSIGTGFSSFDDWDLKQRKLVLTRLDSIMFGFLGAWTSCYHKDFWLKWKKPAFLAGIIIMILPPVLEALLGKNMIFTGYFSLSLTSIGTLLLLPAMAELRTGKGAVYRFMTFVSKTSYSIYLVNFSLIQLTIIPSLTGLLVAVTSNHLQLSILRYLIYWSLTFLLAYLLYRFYEKPFMDLREKVKFSLPGSHS